MVRGAIVLIGAVMSRLFAAPWSNDYIVLVSMADRTLTFVAQCHLLRILPNFAKGFREWWWRGHIFPPVDDSDENVFKYCTDIDMLHDLREMKPFWQLVR